jgi:tetratricopeptide (TPR) repeat protein
VRAVIVGIGILLLLSGTARADKAQAEVHYRAGNAHVEAGRYYEAIREYRIAQTLYPSPAIVYNMAIAHELAGDLEDALRLYIDVSQSDYEDAERMADARLKITRIREKIGAPPTPIPIEKPTPTRIPIIPIEKPTPTRRVGLYTAITGAVAIAAGSYFAIRARAKQKQVSSVMDSWTERDLAGIRDGRRSARRSRIFLGLGAAITTAGVSIQIGGRF